MKKFFTFILITVIAVICITFTACDFNNNTSSTAVTKHELTHGNFAAEKEAEDDAKGREHIEIPADAKTVEIDNEEWIVLRSIEEFEDIWAPSLGTAFAEVNLTKNYIVANDIHLNGWRCYASQLSFKGKFNGNNYKFYSKKESNGFGSCLFNLLENALVENVIISSSDGYYVGGDNNGRSAYLVHAAFNSTIKNCVNYFQPTNHSTEPNASSNLPPLGGALMYGATNCIIENCINYGSNCCSMGGIVYRADGSTIRGCKNYGNLVSKGGALGGIVSYLQKDNTIENCENYGHIIGKSRLGGIVGSVWKSTDEVMPYSVEGLEDAYYTDNQIIKDCKNFGNIYLLKDPYDNRLETTTLESNNKYRHIIYEFGGIAGSASIVENCINEGSFYGFENMGNQIKVDYLGGVVGAAKQVINCENKGEMQVQNGRALRVGDIYGYLDN